MCCSFYSGSVNNTSIEEHSESSKLWNNKEKTNENENLIACFQPSVEFHEKTKKKNYIISSCYSTSAHFLYPRNKTSRR